MFEYAISNGEGTLLEYGTVDIYGITAAQDGAMDEGHTMIFGPAADDCATGQ